MHNGSSLSLLSLALPLVDLEDQFEEGTFGGGHVSMPRPPQVLELPYHQVAFLRLGTKTQNNLSVFAMSRLQNGELHCPNITIGIQRETQCRYEH